MEEKLILAIEKHPILYDKTLSAYKSSNSRENAWKEVSKEMNIQDVESLKKRWRTLRDAFIKHYRMSKLTKSGSAGGKKKKWIYYDQMLFLTSFIDFKETIGSYSQDETQDYTVEGPINNDTQNINSDDSDIPSTQDAECSQGTGNISEIPRKKQNIQDVLNEVVPTATSMLLSTKRQQTAVEQKYSGKSSIKEKCKQNTSKITDNALMDIITKKDDPHEQFMLSCVPILKQLTPRNNLVARMQIQNILFNLAFGDNCESRSSTHTSTLSVTPQPSPSQLFSPLSMENSSFTSPSYETPHDQFEQTGTQYNYTPM